MRFCGALKDGRLAYWLQILLNADAPPPPRDQALQAPIGSIVLPRPERRRTDRPKSVRDWLSELRE